MTKTVLAAFLCCASLIAQEYLIPPGSSIFIEAMEHDLDGYLKAEFVKKKIRLRVAPSIDEADYVLTGSATDEEKRKWHQGWLTAEQDRTNANIVVVEKESGEMVWAGEAGDRSLSWGSLARGGHRKVASRLANQLKKAVTGPPRRASRTRARQELPTTALSPASNNGQTLSDDVVKLLRDPLFREHPRDVQLKVLRDFDTSFAALAVETQAAVLDDPRFRPVAN